MRMTRTVCSEASDQVDDLWPIYISLQNTPINNLSNVTLISFVYAIAEIENLKL